MKELPKHIQRMALSRDLKPTIRVGKSGLSDNLMTEISEQLASKDIVKVKINRGLFDKSDIAELWNHIARTTNSTIVSVRGNVGVLWKG
ncbi:MAG TPA: YhbY family RNA-binding protein [Candidatus Poseidoniaceae archaeon]|nr:MAG TPA: YhbY family RNA-binding protein [Candidatus Poseidoniales archaeon]HII45242.1 YhbY family RNA-binding protein [Candidatus Poseidoniaceae archaeon]